MTDAPARILLVEDEPHLAVGIRFNLESEGYNVVHVETGEAALTALEDFSFELLVLDLMLPGIDGLEVCRRVRKDQPQLPILMLTARTEEADRVAGLATGADDYLTKPFSLAEFLLRVAGLLRRSRWQPQPPQKEHYDFGVFKVDLTELTAETPRGAITLTDQEAKLLRLFFANEGHVVTRQQLLSEGWGMAPDTETRTLDNFIVRLRKYFEPDPSKPQHFITVRGRGYKFQKDNN